jgi:excisionase family DNA binding protein
VITRPSSPAPLSARENDARGLVTAAIVADLLGLSPSYVRDLTRSGELPGFRIGRTLRYRRSEIEQWIEQQRVGADRPAIDPTPSSNLAPVARLRGCGHRTATDAPPRARSFRAAPMAERLADGRCLSGIGPGHGGPLGDCGHLRPATARPCRTLPSLSTLSVRSQRCSSMASSRWSRARPLTKTA